jgi:hypothetical protein
MPPPVVLVAEDEPSVRSVVAECLRDEGYAVRGVGGRYEHGCVKAHDVARPGKTLHGSPANRCGDLHDRSEPEWPDPHDQRREISARGRTSRSGLLQDRRSGCPRGRNLGFRHPDSLPQRRAAREGTDPGAVRQPLDARVIRADVNSGVLTLKAAAGPFKVDLPGGLVAAFQRGDMVPIELAVMPAPTAGGRRRQSKNRSVGWASPLCCLPFSGRFRAGNNSDRRSSGTLANAVKAVIEMPDRQRRAPEHQAWRNLKYPAKADPTSAAGSEEAVRAGGAACQHCRADP